MVPSAADRLYLFGGFSPRDGGLYCSTIFGHWKVLFQEGWVMYVRILGLGKYSQDGDVLLVSCA